MSWDLDLVKDGQTVELAEKHNIRGGTYCLGGTTEASLNITYNYGKHYRDVFGSNGIHVLNGKTAQESLQTLALGIAVLNNDESSDYWEPTEGNARRALINLFVLATMVPPDAVWTVS